MKKIVTSTLRVRNIASTLRVEARPDTSSEFTKTQPSRGLLREALATIQHPPFMSLLEIQQRWVTHDRSYFSEVQGLHAILTARGMNTHDLNDLVLLFTKQKAMPSWRTLLESAYPKLKAFHDESGYDFTLYGTQYRMRPGPLFFIKEHGEFIPHEDPTYEMLERALQVILTPIKAFPQDIFLQFTRNQREFPTLYEAIDKLIDFLDTQEMTTPDPIDALTMFATSTSTLQFVKKLQDYHEDPGLS